MKDKEAVVRVRTRNFQTRFHGSSPRYQERRQTLKGVISKRIYSRDSQSPISDQSYVYSVNSFKRKYTI